MIALIWLIVLMPFLLLLALYAKKDGIKSALVALLVLVLGVGGGTLFLTSLIMLARYYMYGEAPRW